MNCCGRFFRRRISGRNLIKNGCGILDGLRLQMQQEPILKSLIAVGNLKAVLLCQCNGLIEVLCREIVFVKDYLLSGFAVGVMDVLEMMVSQKWKYLCALSDCTLDYQGLANSSAHLRLLKPAKCAEQNITC